MSRHDDNADLARVKLASSGLTIDDAKALGIKALTPSQTQALQPAFFKALPALQLNYHDLRGKLTGFYRIRYLAVESSVAAMTKDGAKRYVQPPDTLPQVYLPRVMSWERYLEDVEQPLHLTEGELKAACACKHGFVTLGLGGVYSWKSAKRGVPLVAELAAFRWQNRRVYITFDSDASSKPQVSTAARELCDTLTALGAHPYLVALPSLSGQIKTGLDDLLVAEGPNAYTAVLDEAQPYSAARELWTMNTEVVYVRDPGLVIALKTGQRISAAAYAQHAYANRHYWLQQLRDDGSVKLVKKPLAPAWLQWEQRAELKRITYAPGQPTITDDGEYNFWRGWGCEPDAGDVSLWRELLDFLFKDDTQARTWFERWCAYPLQHPGAKLFTAAVLWGVVHGTGKSLVGYTLMRIYGANATEIDDEALAATHNEWAENKQFVMGDDVVSSEHRRASADRLKHMVTRQELRLNPKFIPSYTVPDRINYYLNSNHPDSFYLEDTDRRYFVHEVVGQPHDKEFYRRYDRWLRGGAAAPAVFHHLLRLDLGDFDPNAAAPMTRAKLEMIHDNKSDLASWVAQLRSHPDEVLKLGEAPVSFDLLTNQQLLRLYDPEGRTKVTANGLGRELKKAGFRYANDGAVVMTSQGPQRFYVVRNAKRWLRAATSELVKHLDGKLAAAQVRVKRKKF